MAGVVWCYFRRLSIASPMPSGVNGNILSAISCRTRRLDWVWSQAGLGNGLIQAMRGKCDGRRPNQAAPDS